LEPLITIRTAVIGFGTSGRVFHAPLLRNDPAFSLDIIVTSDPTRAAAASAEYPHARILGSVDEMFAASSNLDLVVVGSPNSTHSTLATRALEAGLDVLIDKPIAVTSTEADTMLDRAAALGRRLAIFQNRRWDGDYMTIRELIRGGQLGEVHQFDSAFEWWSPAVSSRWKDTNTFDQGGGIFYDLAPHLIDQAVQLFGPVVDVHYELDTRRPGAGSDDDSFVSLQHAQGTRTRLWMSAIAPAPRQRFRIVGSKRVATISGLDPQEPQLIDGIRPGDAGYGVSPGRSALLEGPDGSETIPVAAGDYPSFYRLLAEALRDHTAPLPVDPNDSVQVLKLIERGVQA
jgi:predicted dehydrogenase